MRWPTSRSAKAVSALPRRHTTQPLVRDHPNAVGTRVVLTLTPAHDAVLAVLDWLPAGTVADAALVAAQLAIPEADAARPPRGA
jgi:hypothetical protein